MQVSIHVMLNGYVIKGLTVGQFVIKGLTVGQFVIKGLTVGQFVIKGLTVGQFYPKFQFYPNIYLSEDSSNQHYKNNWTYICGL